MKKRAAIALATLWSVAFWMGLTRAEEGKVVAAAANKPAAEKSETVVTSDSMDYDYIKGLLVFKKDVLVDAPTMKLWTDLLTIEMEGTNQIRSFVANGNVRFEQAGGNRGSCREMRYWKDREKVEMRGDVILFQGDKGTSADHIVFVMTGETIHSVQARGNLRAVFPDGGGGLGGIFPSPQGKRERKP